MKERFDKICSVPGLLLVGLSLVGLLGLPATGYAKKSCGQQGDPTAQLEHKVEKLGVDDATLNKVYKIIDTSRPQRRALRKQLREAYERMHALFEEDAPDEAAVMAQSDVIGKLKTQIKKIQLRTLLRVRAQLTKEQREKLTEMMHHGCGESGGCAGRHGSN